MTYPNNMSAYKKLGILLGITVFVLTPVWAQAESTTDSNTLQAETEHTEKKSEQAEKTSEQKEETTENAEKETGQTIEITRINEEGSDAADSIINRGKWIDNYHLSLFPLAGFLLGRGEEILYKYSGSKDYASQLLWDLKPVAYLGLDFDFGLKDPFQTHGLLASASVKFGLPLKSGIMEDSDWSDDGYLSDYSRQEAYSMNTVLLDVAAGYSWRIIDNLTLGAYAEFSYIYQSWSGENGYTQYTTDIYGNPIINEGIWTESVPKTDEYGPIILYNQNWLIVSPGILAKYKISRYFTVDGFFSYTPLIFCIARDDHLITNPRRTSWDYPRFGHCINGGVKLSYLLLLKTELSCSVSYKRIFGSRGYTIFQPSNSDGQVYLNAYQSGAGFGALDVTLAVRINIFGR